MIEHEGKNYITSVEAAQILNVQTETVRQMTYRKRFHPVKLGQRLYFLLEDVQQYKPKKYGLPRFESLSYEDMNQKFIPFPQVVERLKYSKQHIRALIRRGELDAYCTSEGVILISQASLDRFLGVLIDAADL